jgi:predicted branched-subunit amino acid permease
VSGQPVRFTWDGARRGALAILPISPGAVAFGLVYGYLGGQKGISALEIGLTSGLVFAGAAQLVALELWVEPLPLAALITSVLVINLRHLLMGPVLLPWLAPLPPWQAYGSLYLLVDESWGVSVVEQQRGGRDAAFLAGAGGMIWLCFVGSSVLGRLAGDVSALLEGWGLDFLTTAFFVALLAGFWRGRADLLPWLTAAAIAVAVKQALPGTWHIVAGALAGSLVGAWRQPHGRR